MEIPSKNKSVYGELPPGWIRLLKIQPHGGDDTLPIACGLFDYLLVPSPPTRSDDRESHMFQALSYVWGPLSSRPDGLPPNIIVNRCVLSVTLNLHAALRGLRNRSLDRTIWIDAVCINQGDLRERAQQIQLMTEIYSQDILVAAAVEAIRMAAAAASFNKPKIPDPLPEAQSKQPLDRSIVALLRLDWFKRIWVLQEVAAARQILIICGSVEIDGYTFATGLDSFTYDEYPDLEWLISPVTYLIREAIFRPRTRTQSSSHGRFSLGIRPLYELISMYHSRQATLRVDKIFALLSMASDEVIPEDLAPNYKAAWSQVFRSLISFILLDARPSLIETWNHCEVAVMTLTATVAGEVIDVITGPHWQKLRVMLKTRPGEMVRNKAHRSTDFDYDDGLDHTYGGLEPTRQEDLYTANSKQELWLVPVSARPVHTGDVIIVPAPSRESNPIIVRPSSDHFSVILMSVNTPQRMKRFEDDVATNLVCVWDWGEARPGSSDLETVLTNAGCIHDSAQDTRKKKEESRRYAQKMAGFEGLALVMENLGRYGEACRALRQVLKSQEVAHGLGHSLMLATMGKLAHVLRKARRWAVSEELFRWQLRTRLKVLGAVPGQAHPDVMETMQSLTTLYEDQRRSEDVEEMRIMMEVFSSDRPSSPRKREEQLVRAAGSLDAEMLTLLIEREVGHGAVVAITEELMMAAAVNKKSGAEVMRLLLGRIQSPPQQKEDRVTEEVVAAAGTNIWSGLDIMRVLVEQLGSVKLTPYVASKVFANQMYGMEMVRLLLGQDGPASGDGRRGDMLDVVEIFVHEISQWGDPVRKRLFMNLVIEQRGRFHFLPAAVTAVARSFDQDTMQQLIGHRGAEVRLTESLLKVIMGQSYGLQILKLMMVSGGLHVITVTEGLVRFLGELTRLSERETFQTLMHEYASNLAVTDNGIIAAVRLCLSDVIKALLAREEWLGDESVRQRVVEAAAGNWRAHNMQLLLEQSWWHSSKPYQVSQESFRTAAGCWRSREMMKLLLEKTSARITEDVMLAAAANPTDRYKMMQVFLDERDAEVVLTDDIIAAVAHDLHCWYLLFERRPGQLRPTEEIAVLAAGFDEFESILGFEIVGIFLDHGGEVTDQMVEVAANNVDILRELLDRRPDDVRITPRVMELVVGNIFDKWNIMALLEKHKGIREFMTPQTLEAVATTGDVDFFMYIQQAMWHGSVRVTESLLRGAVANLGGGTELVDYIREQWPDKFVLTEDIAEAAATNIFRAVDLMRLFLDERGHDITTAIADRILKAATQNDEYGATIVSMLIDAKWERVRITEDMVKVAVANEDLAGEEILWLLLDKLQSILGAQPGPVRTAHLQRRGEDERAAAMVRKALDEIDDEWQ